MLDTRLKNNSDRKGLGLFVSVVLLALLATAVLFFYKPIVQNAKGFLEISQTNREKDMENLKESEESNFLECLFQGNYILKWDLERQKSNKKFGSSDVYLNNIDSIANLNDENDENTDDDYDNFKNDFASLMDDWYYKFYYGTLSKFQLEYYIKDNTTDTHLTNTGSDLSAFLSQGEKAENIKKQYYFYAVLQFDKDGNLDIPYFHGVSKSGKDTFLSLNLTEEMVNRSWNNAAWYASRVKKLSDMTVVYAVKSESFLQNDYQQQMGYLSSQMINDAYSRAGAGYLYVISIILVLLLGFILPAIKPLGVGNGIEAKIPLEIWAIGAALTVSFYDEVLLDLIRETVKGDLFTLNGNHIFTEGMSRVVVNIFNVFIWFLIFICWFAAALSIRELFIKKPVKYLKENTISFRFLFWIGRNLKKGWLYVSSFDMSKKDNKKILLLLGGNMIVMIILCSMWEAGVIGAIIYTGILFYFINKYKNKITSDYNTITEAAGKLSEGNLEVTIGNAGIFNPLKEQLMRVQQGFRKAVLEETKSQKMKAELITNVSHDLKTPLTAIITYVDLLKDENLSEEQRASYVETLDRKALRLKILIEDLFEMSKAASNTISMNPVELDIAALLKQLQFELSDRVTGAGLDFRVRIPDAKVIAWLDSDKTYRIFENLLINMCKYALHGSRAYLDMEVKGNEVNITVRNISQEELDFTGDEIVERFVRGDKARNSEGSGLGLAIAKSFTELQGGTFQVITDGDLFKVVVSFHLL